MDHSTLSRSLEVSAAICVPGELFVDAGFPGLTLFINTAVILRLPKVFFEINATQVCLGVVTCHQPGGLIPVVSPWTFRQSLAG